MRKLAVTLDDQTFQVEIDSTDLANGEWSIRVDGEPVPVIVPRPDVPLEWLVIGERPYEILIDSEQHWIQWQGRMYHVRVRDLDVPVMRPRSTDGRIKAPIPGQISQVLVKPGERIEPGNTVLILEAMKMENHILAPVGGVVSSVQVEAGQGVMLNQVLAEITVSNE